MRRKRNLSLEKLVQLAPPPLQPVDAGASDQWTEVEAVFGVTLPNDYKRLINTYGAGTFCDQVCIISPFPVLRNLKDFQAILRSYTHTQKRLPQYCPFTIFPNPGGLLPIGTDLSGGTLYWLTQGQPDEWPLVLYDDDNRQHETYKMTLTTFLASWLAGTISPWFSQESTHLCNISQPIFQTATKP